MSKEVQLIACKAISNGALSADELPSRLKVLDWGKNAVCDGTEVLLDDASIKPFEATQKKTGRTRIALDYNHATVDGTKAHKEFGDRPNIFAYGTPVIIPGDGLWLEDMEWTPFGEKYARNCEDISPAPLLKEGRVIGLDSCALTPNGAIDGLQFYTAETGVLGTYSSVTAYASACPVEDDDDDQHAAMCMCAHCMGAKLEEFEADDHKSEYGDVAYADTKNHKYPIDNEKHVRAAWSYINMPKNQKGYSPSEVAAIKRRIRSKFSKYGIEESDTTKPKSMTAPTPSVTAPKSGSVQEPPAFSGQPTSNQELSMEIKAHIAKFRAELGMPETASDEDVMDRVRGHWDTIKAKQPNLSDKDGTPDAQLEKGNIPTSESTPHATITYSAIEAMVTKAVAALAPKAPVGPTDAEKKAAILAQATKDGKIVPLSAPSVETTPVAVLEEIVKNLPAGQVPMAPKVRAFSADDNKGDKAVAVQTTKSAWSKAVGA